MKNMIRKTINFFCIMISLLLLINSFTVCNASETSEFVMANEPIHSVYNGFLVILIISILYLIVETIIIIKKDSVSNIWCEIINILIAFISICFLIPSIAIIKKQATDNKKTKIVMNIIAILFLICEIFVFSVIERYAFSAF